MKYDLYDVRLHSSIIFVDVSSFCLRQNNEPPPKNLLFSLLSLKKFLIIKVAHECCLPMVIIWISVLLAIKAVNSCVYYECSARKLFHSSGHGSPNLTEFWICLFKYHTAFVIMWIYTLYAEKWSMYLRKKQRHTCNRQSSARTWTDLLQAHRLCGFILCERVKWKNKTPSNWIWRYSKEFETFEFFFFFKLCDMLFFSYMWVQENVHWTVGKQFLIFVWIFPSPSPSQERGECEKVFGFFLLLFWSSP